MGIFCKCKKETPKEKIFKTRSLKIIDGDAREFDVGKTRIELKFKDEHIMITTIYGDVYENLSFGRDETEYNSVLEPVLYEFVINKSIDKAKNYTKTIGVHDNVYTNDELTNAETHMGTVIHVTILDTTEYKQTLITKKIVPV
jgi:hypothetical protein